MMLSGALLRWWWGVSEEEDWSARKDLQAVAVLNEELLREPSGLVGGPGFDRVVAALPRGVSLGVSVDEAWVRTSVGFFDDSSGKFHGPRTKTLFTWTFVPGPGREALLEVRWSPREAAAVWGTWALVGMSGLLFLVIGTIAVLTWLVSRSVIRPLGTLEAAARRLGEGDLEPGTLPQNPPEFRRVGLTLDDLRRRLKESLLDRQALEEERRTWVASMSHDLRTPLSVIRGYAEGLRDGVASTPEKQARYHAVILERAQQLERQVDDLFQWARWDWGQPQLRLQALDLADQLTVAWKAWTSESADLTVDWLPPPGAWPVLADPLALRRIFDNLARNVIQHAGPQPRLHVDLSDDGSHWVVSFRDEGPGMAPEVLPRVFDRFYRGDPARNPGQGGGGLGLTIARVLAEGHGGTLEAANAPEGGAIFTLRLPRGTEP